MRFKFREDAVMEEAQSVGDVDGEREGRERTGERSEYVSLLVLKVGEGIVI